MLLYIKNMFKTKQSRETDFERNNAFSLYDLYGHAPAKEPLHVGHEIYSFGRPFLGH